METPKKTLLYVITKSSWGGAQKYILDVAPAMQTDYKVVVACGRNEFTSANLFIDSLHTHGVTVHEIASMGRDISILDELKSARELYRILRQEKPDIVHLNSPKAGGLGGLVARIARIPRIVYTAHGLNSFEDRPRWQKVIIACVTQIIFLLAHRIILISKREMDFVAHWITYKKHNLVYNGVKTFPILSRQEACVALVVGAPNIIKEKIAQDSTVVIGGISELTKNKGLVYLLTALVQLIMNHSNIVYVHFGTGDQDQILRTMVINLGLSDYVWFAGFNSDAKSFLSAFDILAFPSIKEGLPYVPLEAGLAGLAVVATDVGGVSEIIQNQKTGLLVNPSDALQLSEALGLLVVDSNLRLEYGDALQNHVLQNFSFYKMCEATKTVYNA